MKVFISWSGNAGREFAKILYEWLPSVLQAVKPFYSPDDIAKGARWGSEVSKELEGSQLGIVVVTRESMLAPWIMFESGALSKNVGRSKVVPILVDIEADDIGGPLTQFQCAKFEATEMKRVLRMLNSELRDASLTESVLESVFKKWWPDLESKTNSLISKINVEQNHTEDRTEKDILDEILGLTRSIAKRQSEEISSVKEEIESPIKVENTGNWFGSLSLETVRNRIEQGGNLVGANLMELNLARMDMSNADMRGANLVGVNLSGAKLVGANLLGANLESAILDGADLKSAVLDKTNLWRASMIDVKNFSSIKSMNEANTYEVKLSSKDRKVMTKYKTLDISDYQTFYKYYFNKGMSKDELREVFLWTAHSYPGEDF